MTWPANHTPNTARQTAAAEQTAANGQSPIGKPGQSDASSSQPISATGAEPITSSASATSDDTSRDRAATLARQLMLLSSQLCCELTTHAAFASQPRTLGQLGGWRILIGQCINSSQELQHIFIGWLEEWLEEAIQQHPTPDTRHPTPDTQTQK